MLLENVGEWNQVNGNLMDTNVIIRILNGDEKLVKNLSVLDNLCTSVIVLGELFYGAEKSVRAEQNKQNAKDFCSNFPILEIKDKVSEVYGYIKKDLLSHGNVLPENDMWIAATAIANKVSVITQDKHFESISGLSVIKM